MLVLTRGFINSKNMKKDNNYQHFSYTQEQFKDNVIKYLS